MKKQSGMSIIETMISLAILSFGLIASVRMQLNINVADSLARQRSVAVSLAQSKIEELRGAAAPASGTDTCKNSNPVNTCQLVQSSADFTRTWTVGTTSPKTVKVLVVWNDLRNDQSTVKNSANVDTGKANKVEFNTAM